MVEELSRLYPSLGHTPVFRASRDNKTKADPYVHTCRGLYFAHADAKTKNTIET